MPANGQLYAEDFPEIGGAARGPIEHLQFDRFQMPHHESRKQHAGKRKPSPGLHNREVDDMAKGTHWG